MLRPRWEPCAPPRGYHNSDGKPYRAWRNTYRLSVILVECPHRVFGVDSGVWQLRKGVKVLAELHWHGRSRKKPPTTWANRILEQTP